jgi:predicted ATPase
MRRGLAAYQGIGAGVFQPYVLTLLAEMYGKIGQIEDGLAVLAEALTMMEKTGERFWEAELYRIKGELLLKNEGGLPITVQGQKTEKRAEVEAEQCFLQALDIARQQSAKTLELRGKRGDAFQRLTEIYGWFTEGFDTADLREAKALLAILA